MSPQGVQDPSWWPPLAVLAVALLAAALYLLLRRGSVSAPQAPAAPAPKKKKARAQPAAAAAAPARKDDGTLDTLEARAQGLIGQLRALKAEEHALGPERYAAERARLERAAADALRARDEYRQSVAAPPPPAAEAPAAPASRAGLAWVAVVVAFCGVLGYLLVENQQSRQGDAPITGGGAPGGPAPQAPQETDELDRAMARLRADPNDLEAAAIASHELLRMERVEEAEAVVQRGLAVDPFDVELRVHRGVARAMRGDAAAAEQELLALVDLYPGTQEAVLFLGSMALQAQDFPKALAHFERFMAETPARQHPPQLVEVVADLRRQVGPAPTP